MIKINPRALSFLSISKIVVCMAFQKRRSFITHILEYFLFLVTVMFKRSYVRAHLKNIAQSLFLFTQNFLAKRHKAMDKGIAKGTL